MFVIAWRKLLQLLDECRATSSKQWIKQNAYIFTVGFFKWSRGLDSFSGFFFDNIKNYSVVYRKYFKLEYWIQCGIGSFIFNWLPMSNSCLVKTYGIPTAVRCVENCFVIWAYVSYVGGQYFKINTKILNEKLERVNFFSWGTWNFW